MNAIYYNQLRPEFLISHAKMSLNSDVFSPFARKDPDRSTHEMNLAKADAFIKITLIPQVAKHIETRFATNATNFSITEIMHR